MPRKNSLEDAKSVILHAFGRMGECNVPRLAASLSFYAVLSLAPLLVLGVAIGGAFLGESHARAQVLKLVNDTVGSGAEQFLGALIDNTRKPTVTIIATAFSLIVTFFGASNLFLQLNDSINTIWALKDSGSVIRNVIVGRLLAFAAVLGFGFLAVAWLAFDTVLAWASRNSNSTPISPLVSPIATVLFLTLAFAITFRALPKATARWRDVWPGAFLAAIGFAASKWLLSLYFNFSGVSVAYGSAGSLVVILLWIYYTSQILFFGVTVTYSVNHLFGPPADEKDQMYRS